MKHSHPPRLARLLLASLGPRENPLLGDLLEEYRCGRSRLWFWGQTLHAVAAATRHDIRHHPVLVLRGVTLSVMLGGALLFGTSSVTRFVAEGMFRQMVPLEVYLRFRFFLLTGIVLSVVGSIIVGWIVATCHHRQRAVVTVALILLYVSFLIGETEWQWLWEIKLIHWRFMPHSTFFAHLALELLAMLTWPLGMIIGGILLPVPSQRRSAN